MSLTRLDTWDFTDKGAKSWTAAIWIVLALALCGVIAMWVWLSQPTPTPPATAGTQQAVPLPPAVTTPPSIEIPNTGTPDRPTIRAIPKTPEVRKRTKLPPALFDGPDTFIMATGALDAERRTYTLSSVLDRRTGETQVHAVADPLPWLARGREYEIAIGYTMRHGVEVKARADLVQIKSLYSYAEARANQDEADIAAYIGYRF